MLRRAELAEHAQRSLSALLAVPVSERTAKQNRAVMKYHREYLKHRDALDTLAVKPTIGDVPIDLGTRLEIANAAAMIIGTADNYGICLLDIIAEIERYIVKETKVTDARGEKRLPDRNQYTLAPRLVRWSPPVVVDCGVAPASPRLASRAGRASRKRRSP
jgi:hypothetical protein